MSSACDGWQCHLASVSPYRSLRRRLTARLRRGSTWKVHYRELAALLPFRMLYALSSSKVRRATSILPLASGTPLRPEPARIVDEKVLDDGIELGNGIAFHQEMVKARGRRGAS